MIAESVDQDIDAELPLLAGRQAQYVTTPHSWPVDRLGEVTASCGRLTVELHGDGWIYDSEDYSEDENQYGVPSSSQEVRALAELYEQAEQILAAYRSGEYVPPAPLPLWYDRKPRRGGLYGFARDTWLDGMASYLNGIMSLMPLCDPLEPYTRQEKFTNVWRRMRGLDPTPRRPKSAGGWAGYVKGRKP